MQWFFGLIAAVVVIVIAAIVIVPLVVDRNDFKSEIVEAVKSSKRINSARRRCAGDCGSNCINSGIS